MTESQFQALADLLRLRPGAAKDAAKLVMVFGMTTPAAAKVTAMPYRAAYNAVQRVKKGLAKAHAATK